MSGQDFIVMNVTNSISSFGSFSQIGWIVTGVTFGFILLFLFLIFRNFRRTVYGAVISGIILVVYKISRWIGLSTEKQNYIPIKWFSYIIGFILLSWFLGYLFEKLKLNKKISKWWENLDKEKK